MKNIFTEIKEEIRFKEKQYSLLNLKDIINDVLLKKYKGVMYTAYMAEQIKKEIAYIVTVTIQNHINCGDISRRFEKDFQKFLFDMISVDYINHLVC